MRKCSTKKERFGTERHCKKWIDKWNSSSLSDAKGKLKRAYLCPECLTWHATSHEQNEYNSTNDVISNVKVQIESQLKLLEQKSNRIAKLKSEMHYLTVKINELINIDKQMLKKINEL